MIEVIAWVVIYVAVSFLNFGAINADSRNGGYYDRHEAAVNVLVALTPVVGSGIAVFGTGFFEHGFSWKIGCPAVGVQC